MTDASEPTRTRLETEAIVIGYAMSRLDEAYLQSLGFTSWTKAFEDASASLQEPANSFKNLRDEFDPYHSNTRQGWHKRPIRQNRQRVLDELADVSDDALIELARRILARDESATAEAIDSLAVVTKRPANVAERLLTGRLAEEYYLDHCNEITQHMREDILDFRQAARGFDFGISNDPLAAIEVKGLKTVSGRIQFTDHEWTEARFRGDAYLLVVVGSLEGEPIARVFRDPHTILAAECRYQTSVAATWQSSVSVAASRA
jgi:hypothetical protein